VCLTELPNRYNDPFEDMFTKVVFICAYSTVFALCVFGKYNIFICLSVLILPGVKKYFVQHVKFGLYYEYVAVTLFRY
jgi:hypothetical protein